MGPCRAQRKGVAVVFLVFAPQSKVAPQEAPPSGNPSFRLASVSDWRSSYFLKEHGGNSYLSCSFKSYQSASGSAAHWSLQRWPLAGLQQLFGNHTPSVQQPELQHMQMSQEGRNAQNTEPLKAFGCHQSRGFATLTSPLNSRPAQGFESSRGFAALIS